MEILDGLGGQETAGRSVPSTVYVQGESCVPRPFAQFRLPPNPVKRGNSAGIQWVPGSALWLRTIIEDWSAPRLQLRGTSGLHARAGPTFSASCSTPTATIFASSQWPACTATFAERRM